MLHPALAFQNGDDVRQRELLMMIADTEKSLADMQWLQAVEQFDAAWARACEREDPLLTSSGADVNQLQPGQTQRLAGGRAQLEHIFLAAPDEFRNEYREQFENVAQSRISDAVGAADFTELRRLSLRYAFCPAAQSGLRILARQSIDRGDDLEAALLLNRMLRISSSSAGNADTAALSLQIALCNWRAGLNSDAMEDLSGLMRKVPRPSVLQALSAPASADPQELENWFAHYTGVPSASTTEWTQPGGDYRRFASRSLGPARLELTWSSDSLEVHDVLYADRLNPVLQSLRGPMREYDQLQLRQNSIVNPAAMPLRVGELLIFRTTCGIRAVRAADGAMVWEVTHPDGRIRDLLQAAEEIANQSVRAVADLASDEETQAAFRRNMEMQTATLPLVVASSLRNQLVRSNTTAQLVASGATLYVCEDASGSSSDNQSRILFRATLPGQPEVNFMRAYDLKTGLFKWEIGGQTQSAAQPKGKGNLLAGYYFLGAPLILGNRIYVLAENSEGIFLLQIQEPTGGNTATSNPRVLRSQLLTQPQFSSTDHPVRKYAGLMPSYAHGLLICPTCDERIVAVSADDNSVRWVFRYSGSIRRQELGGDAPVLSGTRDPGDSDRADLESRWTEALPRIAGNNVLITPRDSDKLYCLDLQSGQERWTCPRGQFHSIAAITSDAVVLCGNSIVQSFGLDNGRLLWSQSVGDGIVCGRPATDGRLLHLPTSQPAIVSLDLQTGRRLVSRYLHESDSREAVSNGVQAPGNLLIIGNQLFSQNLDRMRAYSQTIDDLPLVDQATERLLRNDTSGAIALLEQGMNAASDMDASRSLLIDVLIESLRTDFVAHRSSIGRIQELIQEADEDRPVDAMIHLMLGMNLSDAALLPDQLHSRSRHQMSELTRLIAQGLSSSENISVPELAVGLRTMLPEVIGGQRDVTVAGPLRRLRSLTFVSEIRKALNRRTREDRVALQAELREAALAALALTAEQSSQLQFVRDLALSGLPELALEILQSVTAESNDPACQLLAQQIYFDVMRSGTDNGAAIAGFLDRCLANNDLTMVRTIHDEFSFPDAASPLNNDQRLITTEALTNRSAFAAWFAAHADKVAPPVSKWGAKVTVEQSDHRTLMAPRKIPQDVPDEVIPLFGSPGKFRGWSFVMLMNDQGLAAYDAEGHIHWRLPVTAGGEEPGLRQQSNSYATCSGSLLLFKLYGQVILLDTSRLTEVVDGEKHVLTPQVLWTRQLDSIGTDSVNDDYRSYLDASERITQFAPQPSGYYPVAPVTPTAVAMISGRRLLVFDTLTGRLMWQLDGIARDAVLLSTSDSVFVLSEISQQIESRSLIDGTNLLTSGLPEWWDEAVGNVGSSVSDFEIEPGESLLWRIAVQGRSCVMFRLGTTKSALECRDLMTDAVIWSIDLPAHSVFSNVSHDVVATLGDGHELKLVRLDTGHVLKTQEVTPVPDPRDLFLIKSLRNYIVLPEGVDDPSIELDPVMEAMHVYGRMYGIDAETLELRWDQPVDHRYVRCVSTPQRVILPNSPVLVLLSRGGPSDPVSGVRRVRYGARLIDVRTGEELMNQNDVGMGLNDFWLRVDEPHQQLELSFESHIFNLDFSE